MNTIDEVQLTAYALGELSASERRLIQEQLQSNPAQQAAVAEIQALAARLEAELRNEPDLALSGEQRQAILRATENATGASSFSVWRKMGGFAAVAAVVTLVFGGAFWASTRALHRQVLASSLEKGEMAVGDSISLKCQLLDETFEPAMEELAELVAPPLGIVEFNEAAPALPDIQDFSSSPVMDSVAELNIASDSLADSRLLMPAAPQSAFATPLERSDDSATIAKKTAPKSTAPFVADPNEIRIRIDGAVVPAPFPEVYGNAESYAPIESNPFKQIADEPLSTFSIDVDTAAYSNVRRFLRAGQMPPPNAVRIEEMVNYFPYDYAPPQNDVPFAVHVEAAACPWNKAHSLVRIGLKGKELAADSRPPCNLVFLVDVSGSMNQPNKLPLVKKSLQLLARQLSNNDRVSIAVYASASGLVLPATPCDNLRAIDLALENLQAGGSTAGGDGIRLAYAEALKTFRPDGNNRVILCTDGDFNVGITDADELAAFIAERARKGIFLTILGFGMGNYKDNRLETLSNKGNGNYAYVDHFSEARKTLVEQATGTLFAIAKDVKLQIEFNPAHFDAYRLVGYENRMLAKEDFNNDQKDAGELGAGHAVTAFYELVPKGSAVVPGVDPLKYQPSTPASNAPPSPATDPIQANPEWLTVKLRYKLPKDDASIKLEIPFAGTYAPFESASDDFRFAASVVAGGWLMRQDPASRTLTYREVIDWTSHALGPDIAGYRREFLDLLKNAAALAP